MSGQQPSLSVSLVSQVDRVSRALSELQRGAPIILVDGDEAAVATAAELLEPLRLQGLRSLAGQGHLSVTAARASTLKARAYDGDLARIRLNDAYGAPEIRAVADPALDLERPLLGPHLTLRDGSAGLDRLALKLCKMALLLPAAAIWPLPSAEAGRAMAARYELITLESALLEKDASWTPVVAARLPVSVSE
ncbi:MAG: GTP cyclohydrolase II, partial [Pseudomonadota bacterium]